MSSLTLSTHRSIAVLARRRLVLPRIASSSRAINGDSKNGSSNPGDEKYVDALLKGLNICRDEPEVDSELFFGRPKQERLEDIFADLFDEKPLPSLRSASGPGTPIPTRPPRPWTDEHFFLPTTHRPPTNPDDPSRSYSAPVNPDLETKVLPGWLTNSQSVDAPSKSAFESISYEASTRGMGGASWRAVPVSEPSKSNSNSSLSSSASATSNTNSNRIDRGSRSRQEPAQSQARPRFGIRSKDTEVDQGESEMDRTRMSPKESKTFDQISNTGAGRAGLQLGKQGSGGVRPVSARLGQLDPSDRYDRGSGSSSSSSSAFPSNYPHSQPRAIDPPIGSRIPRPVRPTMPAHEVDQTAHDEFDRVKEILSGLGSDLAVWEWARENVFRTRSTAGHLTDGETEGGDREGFPGSYSLVLAYLIKLFREEFHNPHLALSAFTLARSHSIRSYVAGCSTAAYNEALSTYWGNFRNLRRVEECVREMSVNGVGWDRHTSKILSGIIENLSETQLSSPAAQFGAGQRRLEAEFGTEVLLRLAALEKRVQADVESKEKGVRMLLGQLHAEKRRREAAGRPAELPTVQEEEVREWDVEAEEREAERSGWDERGTYEARGSERSYDRSLGDRRGSERREHSGPRREDRGESARPSWR